MAKGAAPKARATQREIAEALGVGTRQIRNLLDKGMPAALPDAVHWYVEFKLAEAKQRGPRPATNERTRGEALKNRLLELEIAREEGLSINTQLYRERVREQARQYASAIRSLPQYGSEVFGLPNLVDVQIAMERIANRLLAIGRGDEPEEPDAPAEAAA